MVRVQNPEKAPLAKAPDNAKFKDGRTPLQRAAQRASMMRTERATWMPHWQDLTVNILPRSGKYWVTDTNQGGKRNNLILDNTATNALRVLAAGLMSGITSPARPWMRMVLQDTDLMEQAGVKLWLSRVTNLMLDVFASSNCYRSLHTMYSELGLYGTAAACVLPDYDNVMHFYPMPTGSYALATNHKGEVDTLTRDFQLTVAQCVRQFGYNNCSLTVRNQFDAGTWDAWVYVTQMIQPNVDRDPTMLDNKNMLFQSLYYETGQQQRDTFLSVSGFRHWPALAPRWDVWGNDIYGTSPGMDALGDVKQLQFQQLRKAQAIDYQVNPPLQVPTAYKEAQLNRLPGGIMYVDSAGPAGAVKTAFDVNLNLQHLREDIAETQNRVKNTFYADLFMMLANDTRSGITATEVAERHEEKLLMLGPVLERLHNELLQPLVELTFSYLQEAGALPEAPQAIQGMDVKPYFISVLAQAQRTIAASGMDRLLGTTASIASGKGDPTVWDKINTDQVIDEYANIYGVSPTIIVPDDVVAKMRADRAAAQQAAQQAAALPQMAETARTASEINLPALQDVMGSLGGYSTPAAAA